MKLAKFLFREKFILVKFFIWICLKGRTKESFKENLMSHTICFTIKAVFCDEYTLISR